MYVPKHFGFDDQEELIKFIDNYSFGLLVSNVSEGLVATHLPFMIECENDEVELLGHFAKANSHWSLIENQEVLVVFQGPHNYISPTWFKSAQVPTWNYVAVHVYATVELLHDNDAKNEIILALSDRHERQRPDPWIPDYDESLLNAIVGIRLKVNRIEGKRKLSQNKSVPDREGVISVLKKSQAQDDLSIAQLMQETLHQS